MRLTQLQQRTFSQGVAHDAIEQAFGAPDPREVFIMLLLEHADGRGSLPPVDEQAAAAGQRQTMRQQWAEDEQQRQREQQREQQQRGQAEVEAHSAARAIQARYRGARERTRLQQGWEQEEEMLREELGATQIQTAYRGRRARTELEVRRQRREEDRAQTHRQQQQNEQQRQQQMFSELSERAALQEERYRERSEGAVGIQRVFRGRQGRREAEKASPRYGLPPWADSAATAVQARWRGSKQRRDMAPELAQHTAERGAAAAIVQGRYRSCVAARLTRSELLSKRVQLFKSRADIPGLVSLFHEHDTDGDATISWEEFSTAIRKEREDDAAADMDGSAQPPRRILTGEVSQVTLRAVFDAADTDGDGQLDLFEFLCFLGVPVGAIPAWLEQGQGSADWLAGLTPPDWMTAAWLDEGEALAARRRKRERQTAAVSLRKMRWAPSPHARSPRSPAGGASSPMVAGSPRARAQELAQRRAGGAGPRASPRGGQELRAAELRARAETMKSSPRSPSRAALLAQAREQQQQQQTEQQQQQQHSAEPRTPR